MSMETDSVGALLATDAVRAAPPAVRSWLLSLLAAGEGAKAARTGASGPGEERRTS